jgi:sterol desaturase/sphingolipid hydroxylase (fatty acid hydroxylase superfamily)
MDWLAWSRLHIIELFLTRIFLILPIIFLWFSESAVNYYIVIVSIHSVFIHSNIYVWKSFLDKIIVMPKFHHWHHSDEKIAINKNYAWQIAFYDTIFKTAVFEEKYPSSYWVTNKKNYPEWILKQTIYPFLKNKKPKV